VSLLGSAVNVYFGAEQTPAVELSGPDRLAMPESLAVGATATARLVFAVPYSQQDKVSITLDLLSTTPIVVFEGAVPQD
jgi:hypothetical protein